MAVQGAIGVQPATTTAAAFVVVAKAAANLSRRGAVERRVQGSPVVLSASSSRQASRRGGQRQRRAPARSAFLTGDCGCRMAASLAAAGRAPSDPPRRIVPVPSTRSQAQALEAAAAAAAEESEWSKLAQVVGVLGTQWGDEGKGKLVDVLAQKYDIVARTQGGANAGHTIYDEAGTKYALHLIPSGILNPDAICVVGNGVVVNVPGLFKEMEELQAKGVTCEGRLFISDRAHILFDFHKVVDGLREEELAGSKIGTTKRGIGPAYASKSTRNGVRMCDLAYPDYFRSQLQNLLEDYRKRFAGFEYDLDALCAEYAEHYKRLKPFITDTVLLVNNAYKQGKRILIEGANATMLDIDFGTYPFVTSSNPSVGGIATGLGLAPFKIGELIGVAKAYSTRVGAGPYPTELFGDLGEQLRAAGHEYGTTTGRPRRCGWLDLVALKFSSDINGFTSMNITKLDVLTGLPEIKLAVGYKVEGEVLPTFPAALQLLEKVEVVYETFPGWTEDISKVRTYAGLPVAARQYVERVEELLGVPVRWIGVGPGRLDLITKE